MKYIEKYLKDIIKVKPLGKLTTEEDELDGISGEMVYIDGKCSNIFISHIDYANWLEKQDEQNPTEWSDEDERNMQNIDAVLFYDKTLPENTCIKLRNFLKTLRQRCI